MVYIVVAHIPISLLNFEGVACRIVLTSSANTPKSWWEGNLLYYAEGKQIFRNVLSQTLLFYKKLKNVSCEYDRVNGWNSTLQAAWYIRHVRIIWFSWTTRTIWLLMLSFIQNIVRACSMFNPYEGYRSVNPLDAARVNRTIFHNHSVHWYYITLIRVGIILSTILM